MSKPRLNPPAAIAGGLAALLITGALVVIENSWELSAVAVPVTAITAGIIWQRAFFEDVFSFLRSALVGMIIAILAYVLSWLVLSGLAALVHASPQFGFGLLVMGSIGAVFILPILMAIGAMLALALRWWELRSARQGG